MTVYPAGAARTTAKNKARRSRTLRRTALVASGLIGFALSVSSVIYAYPAQGDPAGSDLVYVIGPPTESRTTAAESIAKDEAVGVLVSVPQEGTHRLFTASKLPICAEPDVTCETPSPFTTKGEALMLVDYARTHDVHKVAVITFTPHVARTRYIFARCAPDIDVQVIGVDDHLTPGDWIYQFGYQTTAFVKAAATPCASDEE